MGKEAARVSGLGRSGAEGSESLGRVQARGKIADE